MSVMCETPHEGAQVGTLYHLIPKGADTWVSPYPLTDRGDCTSQPTSEVLEHLAYR